MSHSQGVPRAGRTALLLIAAAVAGYAWVVTTSSPSQQETPVFAPSRAPANGANGGAAELGRSTVAKGETSRHDGTEERVVVAKLQLPPGACRLQPDAEGNVVGTCALGPTVPEGTLLSPFGGNNWNQP